MQPIIRNMNRPAVKSSKWSTLIGSLVLLAWSLSANVWYVPTFQDWIILTIFQCSIGQLIQFHMMQSSIGRSDWFDWTSKCHIFFSTENNPNNVHIEKKLRLWRFWKFKNFSHFSAFLHPKRYLKVYMVFCKID